jgi:sortase A
MRKVLHALGNILILGGVSLILLAYGPVVYDEAWYWIKTQKHQEIALDLPAEQSTQDSVFARLLSYKPIRLQPVDKNFGIVIEKLGVNAPVVKDVPVTDEKAYTTALKGGVAHASVSDYPSEEPGNVYLFAHSALNFWDLGKYAKVFNLLRHLEIGDKVHVFFEGKDFEYEVMAKEVYKGWNTYPLTRTTIEPLLTLQTCDPPGTTLNRLVVTAKLVGVN